MGFGILVSPGCDFISVMFLKAWSIQNFGYDLRKPKSKSWLTIASLPKCSSEMHQYELTDPVELLVTYGCLYTRGMYTHDMYTRGMYPRGMYTHGMHINGIQIF